VRDATEAMTATTVTPSMSDLDGTPRAATSARPSDDGAPPASTPERTDDDGPPPASTPERMDDQQAAATFERVFFELRKVIVGQNRLLERLLVGVLSRGHCLLESVPGLAKTLAAETLANVVGGSFARVQFTPDLLPSDIVGTRIYRGSTETFDVELGPVFVNFLLTDEINRAPAKVQSALLEVMAEQQVTIGGVTHPVPTPFFVVATQNPIESEGVYQLPDAQRDRFMMKIVLDHPSAAEELAILDRMSVRAPVPEMVLTLDELQALQRRADEVFVDRTVSQYAVDVVQCTRHPDRFGLGDLDGVIALGASPRATLNLVRGARALALMRGRTYATPQDVFDVAPEVLRHRLLMTYDALARDIAPDDVIQRMLATVPAAWVSPKPNDALDRS
jgi:MoxR-like ATPase